MNQPILLAASDSVFEDRLRAAYGGQLNGSIRRVDRGGNVDDTASIARIIAEHSPDVAAVGPAVPPLQALAVAHTLDLEHPEISVIVIADRSPEILEAAMRAGVRDVVMPGAPEADIKASFDRALHTAQRRRAALGHESDSGAAGRSRVITVLSPKGGAGKTTIATNLALGIVAAKAGQVALVDLDLQFGDVSTAMRLMPEHSIADVARAGSAMDAMALKLFLTPHPSGVFALCAPDDPAEGETVGADTAAHAVQGLAEEFPFVVVDTAAGITEATLAAVEGSTDLILVSSFDVPSVRSLRKVVQALNKLGMVAQRRHFVLNRADARVGLMTEDVEATVGMTVDVAVPSSRAVPLSMNQGSPLVESDPRSPAARRMLELAARFVEQPAARAGGSPRFWRSNR